MTKDKKSEPRVQMHVEKIGHKTIVQFLCPRCFVWVEVDPKKVNGVIKADCKCGWRAVLSKLGEIQDPNKPKVN
jgi:hypothetical protein